MEQEKSSKKKSVKFWAVALLLGALLLFIVGGYPLIKQIALDGFGLEATGTVVGVSGADRIQTSIVQFTAADGKQYTFRSHYGNANIRFVEGEEVEIQYLAFYPPLAEVNLLGRIGYPSNIQSTCLGLFLLMAVSSPCAANRWCWISVVARNSFLNKRASPAVDWLFRYALTKFISFCISSQVRPSNVLPALFFCTLPTA